MKKVILTFGLFSMLVLTSFTTPNTATSQTISLDTGGKNGTGTMIPPAKKVDITIDMQGDANFKTINSSELIFNDLDIKKD